MRYLHMNYDVSIFTVKFHALALLRACLQKMLLLALLFTPYLSHASLLGMTWNDSRFVSFDPYTGDVLGYHGGLDPAQNYVGLTRDSSQNILYAAAQSSNNLYRVDANTGSYALLGNINVAGYFGVTSVAFDDVTDELYATLTRKNYVWSQADRTYVWQWASKLVTVDTTDAAVLEVVDLGNIFAGDLAFNAYDGVLYALTADSFDQYGGSANEKISAIDPVTGIITNLFPSQETVLSGFGVIPGGEKLIGWANRSNGHFFTEIDIATGEFTTLANSDASGVCCSGFIYEDFTLADVNFISSPPPPSSVPVPAALWLMISGLLGVVGAASRRSK